MRGFIRSILLSIATGFIFLAALLDRLLEKLIYPNS